MSIGPGERSGAYRCAVEAVTRSVLAHRGRVLVLVLATLVVAVAGLSKLRVDFSALGYFATDDREIEDLLEMKSRWGSDDTELLALVEVRTGTLLEPDRVRSLARISAALEVLPGVERVLALPDLPDWRQPEEDGRGLPVRRLFDPLLSARPGGLLHRQILESSPYVPAALSNDGKAALLAIHLAPAESDDVLAVSRRVRAARRVLDQAQGDHGMRFTLAGIPAVRADAVDLLVRDQLRLVPVVLLSTCLILALFLPFPRGVLVPLATAVVPPLLLFGFMGLTGASVGILNQVLLTLLPALAIADSIHLVHRFGEEAGGAPSSRLEGPERNEAIVRTMGSVGWPCFLTSVTTGLGFLALLTTRIPALRELGLQAALGMLLAHAAVIVLVPLLLSLGGSRPGQTAPAAVLAPIGIRWLSSLLRHPGRVLVTTGGAMLLFVVWGTRVQVDCRLTELLPEGHPTAAANRTIDARLGGTLPLHVELLGTAGTFRDPELLERIAALEAWASTLDGVRAVAGPAGYVATVQGWLSGESGIPSSGAGVVSSLVAGRTAGAPGPELVSRDLASARVMIRTEDRGGQEFLRLADRIEHRFREALPGIGEVRVGGTALVAYRGTNALSEDFRSSLVVAYLTVGTCIGLLWGRWRLGLLCLVLNTLPLLAAYGLLGALGWRFEPPVAVILTLGLGIAVDDTLHVLARAFGAEDASAGHSEAVRRAVVRTAPALVTTSLVLGLAFAVNGTSSFPSISTFGVLGTVVVGTALLADVVVLPALFGAVRWSPRVGAHRSTSRYLRRFFPSC